MPLPVCKNQDKDCVRLVMLKVLRKNTKVIIWSVVLCFALWGGFSVGVQFQKKGRVAGEVFGHEISFQEFNRFTRSSEIFSFNDQAAKDPNFLHRQAWQNLIFSKEAQRRKIDVTDDEVRTEILQLLERQHIENPSPEVYRRWLDQSTHESPQEFETQIRELLRIQKLIRQIHIGEDLPKAKIEELALQKFTQDNKKSEKFTDELKTKYVQEIRNKMHYEKFLAWSMELIQKANLKDYTPQAQSG